ncbi:hypothetical protein N3930_33785, partial [Bacillus thuringiensis]|nr:hypothetical protein [Bacillus thuringiensis]
LSSMRETISPFLTLICAQEISVFTVYSPDLSCFIYSFFTEYEVIADFNANSEMQGGVTYPYYYIEPIEKMQDYTVCKQKETNNVLTVKNEYMKQLKSGEYTVKTDISCAQISVRKGDIVSLIDDSRYFFSDTSFYRFCSL